MIEDPISIFHFLVYHIFLNFIIYIKNNAVVLSYESSHSFKYSCLWKWPSKVTNSNSCSFGFLPLRTFVIHLDKLQVMCRHKRLQLSNLRLRANTPPTVCSPVAVGKRSAGRSVSPIESSLTHRGAGEKTGGGLAESTTQQVSARWISHAVPASSISRSAI